MDKIAVICASNNETILSRMLIDSLQKQTDVEIELHIYRNQFKSAAETFKYAVQQTDSEYLCFVHQDIHFDQNDFLKQTIQAIKNNKRALYGLCGADRIYGEAAVFSKIRHGILNINIGTPIKEITPASGLDEVFLACHRDVFKEIMFDENTFDGWDLYIQDLCMNALKKGIRVYILPLASTHKSILEMPDYLSIYRIYPKSFYRYLIKLQKKYRKDFDEILCPCIQIKTKEPEFSLKVKYLAARNEFRRYLRRKSLK